MVNQNALKKSNKTLQTKFLLITTANIEQAKNAGKN